MRRSVLPVLMVLLSALAPTTPAGAAEAVVDQAGIVKVNSDIAADDAAYGHVGPVLAAAPSDADHLVVTDVKKSGSRNAVLGYNVPGDCMAHVSFDGGQSWSGTVLPIPEDSTCLRRVLPRVAFGKDADGATVVYAAYYVLPNGGEDPYPSNPGAHVGTPIGTARAARLGSQQVGKIVVSRSGDGGLTWGQPVDVPPGLLEKQMQEDGYGPSVSVVSIPHAFGVSYFPDAVPRGIAIAADPDGQDVWVGWAAVRYKVAVWVSRSTDGAQSFADPVPVLLPKTELAKGHMNPWLIYRTSLAFVDGTLHVAYNWLACTDFYPLCFNGGPDSWWFHLDHARSTDGGQSFSEPQTVARDFPVWEFVGDSPPAPPLAVDPENPERVYLAYESQLNGDVNKNIYLVRSLDGGASWEDPVRIGQNPIEAAVPHDRLAISVAPTGGRVDIAWYDGRNDPESSVAKDCPPPPTPCTQRDVYFASSTDAGANWSDDVRVTPESFEAGDRVLNPGQRQRWDALSGLGLVSTTSGARLVWEQSGETVLVHEEQTDSEGNTTIVARAVRTWDLYATGVSFE